MNCPLCGLPEEQCFCDESGDEEEEVHTRNMDEYLDDPRHGQAKYINRS